MTVFLPVLYGGQNLQNVFILNLGNEKFARWVALGDSLFCRILATARGSTDNTAAEHHRPADIKEENGPLTCWKETEEQCTAAAGQRALFMK